MTEPVLTDGEILGRGEVRHVRYGKDQNLWVRFYMNRVYKKPFVEIRVPGDARTVWDKPVDETHKKRFAKQWEEFENNQQQLGGGIPIEQCPEINESMHDLLRHMNCKTVENIVGISDGLIQNLGMGARQMVERVRTWYAMQTDKDKQERLRLELETRDKRIALLESRLAAQEKAAQEAAQQAKSAQVQNVSPKRRRGRPPKKRPEEHVT